MCGCGRMRMEGYFSGCNVLGWLPGTGTGLEARGRFGLGVGNYFRAAIGREGADMKGGGGVHGGR